MLSALVRTIAATKASLFAAPGVLLGVLSCAAWAPASVAQEYPTRPIRMVVTLAPGGPVDSVARMLATSLGEQLGQQVVVDNRPGAGGSVGGEAVARANPDGHTLLMAANGTIAVSPHIIRKLPFDALRDLVPISLVVTSPLGLFVHPGVPARSVKEFIALAQSRPGTINFGSSGNGSTGHLASELLMAAARIQLVHVPYRGAAPAMNDLIAGQIQMQMTAVSGALQFVQAGKLRQLGVTSPRRLAVLPDLPAIAETVAGYEVVSWYGLFTTAGTSPAVIERLHRETVRAVAQPQLGKRLTSLGLDPQTSTPAAFAAMVRSEHAKWGKLIRELGLKP